MILKTVQIKTASGSYPVHLHNGSYDALAEYLNSLKMRYYFLVDANVYIKQTEEIHSLIGFSSESQNTLVLRVSEKLKRFVSVQKILSFLQHHGADRKSVLVVIGGGILGDLGAFAASVYMRGIEYIHVPTTLLAGIDSSVGGKTGINFGKRKNFIGTFYQPKSVWIGVATLNTLLAKEFHCGYGEMIKYAFLFDEEFYQRMRIFFTLKTKDRMRELPAIMAECIAIKARIVAIDEKETGPRKLLNLGHTFAHALESLSGFKIKHGVAVAAGLIYALSLSFKLGYVTQRKYEEYTTFCKKIPFPTSLRNTSPEELYKLMLTDKKNSSGEIRFVLIREGKPAIYDIPVPVETVFEAIKLASTHF